VLLAGLLGAHATALFMLPLFAGTHGRRLDVPAIQFLQAHAGQGRVVSFGPLVPNYGSMFGIAEISHNALPVPQLWVDKIRATLQPGSDGINFYTGFVPPPATLARILPAYAGMGVAYALTWPDQSLPGATPAYQDSVMRIWALPNPAPTITAPGCTLQTTPSTVAADCPAPATLLRRELYWPGWEARVNGAPVTLGQSNIFQTVALPAGHSVTQFSYAPPGASWAWRAAALGACTALLAAAAGWRAAPGTYKWPAQQEPPG